MGHVPILAILERNDTLTIPHRCLGKKKTCLTDLTRRKFQPGDIDEELYNTFGIWEAADWTTLWFYTVVVCRLVFTIRLLYCVYTLSMSPRQGFYCQDKGFVYSSIHQTHCRKSESYIEIMSPFGFNVEHVRALDRHGTSIWD